MLAKWTRAAALSLLSCGVLLLGGCGSDGNPTVVEPGVVTPRVSPTDQETPRPKSPSPSRSPSPTPDNSADDCGPDPGAKPDGATAVPKPVFDDQAELDADGQTGDGRTVDIEEVQLSLADGWIAVCSDDNNRLLGLLRIARSTEEKSVRVTLDERLTTTTQLLVVLHVDNRDGHFDWATDARVSDDDDDPDDLEVDHLTYRVR
jgi:hypothetical protein